MAIKNEKVVLVCLFHNNALAREAVQDLVQSGIARAEIFEIGGPAHLGTSAEGSEIGTDIGRFHLPKRDVDMLTKGLDEGGTLVAVETSEDHSSLIESVFGKYQAKQVDEKTISSDAVGSGLANSGTTSGAAVIPIVEEELVVGKREVETGSTRVVTRVVEIPIEETIKLREEHAVVERRPVDRVLTDEDTDLFRDRSIHINETAEEAVVSKTARVVEEVFVGKEATERNEHISDSVRKTEIEVEPTGKPRA